jgi:hypothetical protein
MKDVLLDVTEQNINEAIENNGSLSVELSINDEIELFQNMDRQELSGMIPGLHEQGLDYDKLKESVTQQAQTKIVIPTLDENTVNEFSDFLNSLNKQVEEFRNKD